MPKCSILAPLKTRNVTGISIKSDRLRCNFSRILLSASVGLTVSTIILMNCQDESFFFNKKTLKPEQIHLSLGQNENEMVVTWVTLEETQLSIANYGLQRWAMNLTAIGTTTAFADGDDLRRIVFTHRAKLKVQPGQFYYYKVGTGDEDSWSPVFTFSVPRLSTEDWSPTVAAYGDLGLENARSLPALKQNVQQGLLDAIIHAGDFAYNIQMEEGRIGDRFMRMVEPLAASVPYMTCPGNHEDRNNFTHYTNRFSMPGDANSAGLYYSFNLGPAHFVVLNTMFYFTRQRSLVTTQKNWLIDDVKGANEAVNRALRPWLIIVAHHPMYCTKGREECRNLTIKNDLEDIFMQNGVDLVIAGHMHNYERFWPAYNFTTRNGTTVPGQPYVNPKAPVHITSGAAGSIILPSSEGKSALDISAVVSQDYGFSLLKFQNKTHIEVQYFAVDTNAVIDDIWLVKTSTYPSFYHPKRRKLGM